MENSIGERLTKLISEFKMTPNAFAVKLGVKTSIIYNIQKEKNKPSFDLIYKISNEFGISTDWLIKGLGYNDESYLKSVILNYAKKDTKKDNLVDNKTEGSVGDTGQKLLNKLVNARVDGDHKKVQEILGNYDELQTLEKLNILNKSNISAETNVDTIEKFKKLYALQASYNNKFRKELSLNNERLDSLLDAIDSFKWVVSTLEDIELLLVDERPDPFLLKFYTKKFDNTDIADYQTYKEELTQWLVGLEPLKNSIKSFNEAGINLWDEIDKLIKARNKED